MRKFTLIPPVTERVDVSRRPPTGSHAPVRTATARPAAEGEGIVTMARNQAATNAIVVHPLRDGKHVLVGSGGNITVCAGREATLVVDAGLLGSRPRITAALRNISRGPVTHLVNTHWHFDHTDGNEWLHTAGAAIIAHENTRRHLSRQTAVEGWQHTFPAAPSDALPTIVFSDEYRLQFDRSVIGLRGYGPAHTDSDISVHFADADVLVTGDTWWNGHYPFIDHSTGGCVDGLIRAAEANVAAAGPDTLAVPGHGPVGGREQLVAFRDMLVTVRDSIAVLKQRGRTLTEVVAARPTASFDASWVGFPVSPSAFTSLVYQGV